MDREQSLKRGIILAFGAIFVGLMYDIIVVKGLVDGHTWGLIGPGFNLVLGAIVAYLTLREEFTEWFKHFSFKWAILSVPVMYIVALGFALIWKLIHPHTVENAVSGILTWGFVFKKTTFMIMGEEMISISLLYALWKKLNLKFWQASLICAILFALAHLPAYGYLLLQVLIVITPTRLILNYLFKRTNSIWVTFVAHFLFDFIGFALTILKVV